MRITVISILLIAIHILESTVLNFARIGGISANFMVMIIISIALLRGSKEGAIVGAAAGLLYDVTYGGGFFHMAITYAIIGYMCGRFNVNFYRENFILPFMCTLAGSIFASISRVLPFIVRRRFDASFFLRVIIIPELIYTITLSLVVYQLIYLINEKIELQEKKTRNIF